MNSTTNSKSLSMVFYSGKLITARAMQNPLALGLSFEKRHRSCLQPALPPLPIKA